MRNITVSVTDETYKIKIARIWATQRDRSLSSAVEYLLRTLPNIERTGQAFPSFTISNSGKISQNSYPTTITNSTTSTPKIAAKTPSENAKLRVKLWTPPQITQIKQFIPPHSTAIQP